ncbi:MAG: hypothetical protein ACSHXK_08680 [Oceanococcus sp.]
MKTVTTTLSLVATLMLCSPANHAAPNQLQASPKILNLDMKIFGPPNLTIACGNGRVVNATSAIETNMKTDYTIHVTELGKTPHWYDATTKLQNGKYKSGLVLPGVTVLGKNKAAGTNQMVTLKWEVKAGTDYKSGTKTIRYTCEGSQEPPRRPRG